MTDIPASTSTTAAFPTAIDPASSFSGEWETFGDHDWIRVDLQAGVTYTFLAYANQPESWVSGGPELRLRNAAGTQIAYDNDSGVGANPLITFTASTAGVYYVDISAFAASFGDDLPGEYSVAVSRQAATNLLMETAGYYGATAGQRVLGSDGNDEIRGECLEAYGGKGDDYIFVDAPFISGGPGNDRLVAGNMDTIIFGDAGFDFLDGYAWNDTLYGGADADYLFGHQGDDRLDGGTGADRMEGTTGDDTCIVDSAGDLALENAGEGKDTVLTSVSYTLAFGQEFEVFGTTAATGTAEINLTGNDFTQRINGNNGSNIIRGEGGNDTLVGYGGNDTLLGGAGADYLSGGAGTDRAVYSSATKAVIVSLANPVINSGDAKGDTYNSIENITGSNYNDALNGNSAANAINGAAGNDTIKGYAGNDTLTGYSGADIFVFNTALNASTNVDRITDYSVAADTIQLDNAVFAALTAAGTLASAAFRANTTGLAQDTSDRIIYETDTGELYYDFNGNASGGGVLFARLATGLALTNADFVVI